MTLATLLHRSLWFHRRSHLAVLLGVVLGTAVLTGSLLLGDSLKGSLQDLTLRRLGDIDFALVSDRFFPANLAERTGSVPLLLLRGTALTRTENGAVRARAGQVQVVGMDERFGPLFGEAARDLSDQLLLNEPVAAELGVKPGDWVELRLERPHAVPADSVIGQRNQVEGLMQPPLAVQAVLPLAGSPRGILGRFNLAAEQAEPRLVFLQLRRLQRLLEQADLPAGQANVLVASAAGNGVADASPLQAKLNSVAKLEDLGLKLKLDDPGQRYVSLTTQRMIFEPELERKVEELAKSNGWLCVPTFTYLANRIQRVENPERAAAGGAATLSSIFTPYSAISGLDPNLPVPFGPLPLAGSGSVGPLEEDEVLLSTFVAEDLWPKGDWKAALGQRVVRVEYFVEGADHGLVERHVDLKLAGVVPLEGPAADRSLTPEFPGLRSTRIADWDPPFPPALWHKEWIRPRDEAFFQKHGLTPKAFVSPALAERLWGSRHGKVTSFRFHAAGLPVKELEGKVRSALQAALKPEDVGLRWLPVKALGLAATSSGTAQMFGGLFVGFSLFIIVAAAMLVGLLFRLAAEQRAKEWGLLFAVGYPARTLRWLLLAEGLLLALLGGVLGLLAALAYTQLLLMWLRRSWASTLSSSFLEFHVLPADPATGMLPYPSLLLGFFFSFLVACLALLMSLRGFIQLAPRALLGGQVQEETRQVGRLPWLSLAALVCALGLAGAGMGKPQQEQVGLFFGSGFVGLAAGIGLCRWWLARPSRMPLGSGPAALRRLGFSYAGRSLGRSVLTVALLAAGTFLVVAVQAFRQVPPSDERRDTGTGGFQLVAAADVALPQVPASPEIWSRLAAAGRGPEETLPAFPAEASVFGLRVRGGDDVSCLNLYQPRSPRLVGVPSTLIERGGFRFHLPDDASEAERANPWLLLERPLADTVPVLADDHAAQWVLQKKIGDRWAIEDEAGRPIQVQLVGMLVGSLFQGELLLSEKRFQKLFPSTAGYRLFLIDAPPAKGSNVRAAWQQALGESFGLTMQSAAEKLASYQAVENTYLSTFQALGGLGLLLGSVGLGVVLLRNFNERRGEWALLRAVGFSEAALTRVALAENLLLVGLGLLLGLAAATLALFPSLISGPGDLPWLGLLLLVLLIPAIGLGVGRLALRSALRAPMLPALQRE